jgi:hypothetical protein
MKHHKVLSHGGPPVISKRGMSETEARAYHHVFDEADSDNVVLTWPRTIPMRAGDRGWADMKRIEQRLPELVPTPTLLLYATEDSVFGKPYADRLKELLPHAEGPLPVAGADHFLQDDRGPEIAAAIAGFLQRTVSPSVPAPGGTAPQPQRRPHAKSWRLELCQPAVEEIASLRADPLLVEQELDVRPDFAEALERATGMRAGRIHWRSAHGHLYALELGDIGRGRPSTATVYGLWERWEPRPPESEIDQDLLDCCLWLAEIAPGIDPADVARVAAHTGTRSGRLP